MPLTRRQLAIKHAVQHFVDYGGETNEWHEFPTGDHDTLMKKIESIWEESTERSSVDRIMSDKIAVKLEKTLFNRFFPEQADGKYLCLCRNDQGNCDQDIGYYVFYESLDTICDNLNANILNPENQFRIEDIIDLDTNKAFYPQITQIKLAPADP